MFEDRIHAGRLLARELRHFEASDPIILGLPRGGVQVAAEVAQALGAPLDVIVVRKLGVPGHPEYAMGALGEDDVLYIDWQVVTDLGITARQLSTAVEREKAELGRRAVRFRAGGRRLALDGRMVIIVDDGIATGSTVAAAIRVARDLGAGRVVVAAPVAPEDTVARLRLVADDVVVLAIPKPFYAVGRAYLDFSQTTDSDVQSTLRRVQAQDRSNSLEIPA